MTFDEGKVSRQPKGTPGGGRFRTNGGTLGAGGDIPAPEPPDRTELLDGLSRWGGSCDDVWPDDPGRMADRILQEADPTLIDDEDRYDAAWREMKAIIEPHLDMMDGPDPGGSARLAMRVMEAEYGG